jgi:hypothetical protein
LLTIMGALGVGVDRVQAAAAWGGEKLGRLKLNGQLRGYSPLSRVVELDGLVLGVGGKRALWITLAKLTRDRPVLVADELQELRHRAGSQLEGWKRTAARASPTLSAGAARPAEPSAEQHTRLARPGSVAGAWEDDWVSEPATNRYEIRRGVVPGRLIDDVLRALHLDLLARGASAEELGSWLWGAHWFPHLGHSEPILALAGVLPADWRTGKRCDPQILLQFPHTGPEPEITFHVDHEPEWAMGRRYRRIVGVPLSRWHRGNGGLLVRLDAEALAVELDPGDAVAMAPDLRHSGGINRTGAIRYGVYFRWLE